MKHTPKLQWNLRERESLSTKDTCDVPIPLIPQERSTSTKWMAPTKFHCIHNDITYLVLAISTGIDTIVVTSPLIMLAAKWHLMSSMKYSAGKQGDSIVPSQVGYKSYMQDLTEHVLVDNKYCFA